MKALIRESGEVLDVTGHQITIRIPKIGSKSEYTVDLPQFYTLSDGITYHLNQLVVGDENIREMKINEVIDAKSMS